MPENQERLDNQKLKSTFTKSSSNMKNKTHTTEHEKKSIGEKLFFLIKIENFYQKKQVTTQVLQIFDYQ